MPSRHEEHSHDAGSDTETDRARRDEAIRQAPYLPKIQIWARDDGPYTLRVGNQWFHCDDLIVNGADYRDISTKRAPSNATVYPPRRRPDAKRAQSYTRTRPNPTNSDSSWSSSPRNSGESVTSRAQYSPQFVPTASDQAMARPKYDTQRQERRDSGISVGSDGTAQAGQIVPYSAPPSQSRVPARPGLDRKPSRQAALRSSMRPRPGVRRGSSFDVPVRSKGRKHVRFEPAAAT